MGAAIPVNWVVLAPGSRVRLHFIDHTVVEREITDPVLKTTKKISALHLRVDREDGKPVDKVLSVVSMKLASELAPYLVDKSYVRYEFVIEKPLDKFAPPRLAEVVPISPPS